MQARTGAAEPIAALNRVRLVESGEPMVDLRTEIPGLKVLRETSVPWARSTVSKMLASARDSLLPNYDIGLREAYRSIERQKFIYDAYYKHIKDKNPGYSEAVVRRLANRFFAPYSQKAPPGHSTGGAVDVWLLDSDGRALELHGPGPKFKSASTFSSRLPEEIRNLRLILHDAMLAAGFSNCRDEWWHYSYGDAAWAVRTNTTECIYGAAEMDPALYRVQDEAFMAEFLKNPPY